MSEAIMSEAIVSEVTGHEATGAPKVAVITGGASGIGLALARRFTGLGWSVAIADVDPEALDAAARSLAELTCGSRSGPGAGGGVLRRHQARRGGHLRVVAPGAGRDGCARRCVGGVPRLIATNIGQSAKHWPERLGAAAGLGPSAGAYTDKLESARGEAPGPDIVADAVLDAIEHDRFLVFPDGATADLARAKRTAVFEPLGGAPEFF